MPPSTDTTGAHLRVVHSARHPQTPVTFQNLLPNSVLGVLIFIGAEVMLFAGLISAFVVLRANAEVWPPPDQPRLPIGITGVNTIILLASGFTMWRAMQKGRLAVEVRTWIAVSALLGCVFLSIQGSEWIQLLGYGLRASTSAYASIFYALIGCHGLHVAGGVIALVAVVQRVVPGVDASHFRDAVAAAGVFWFFVVGLWPLLYVLVYLS